MPYQRERGISHPDTFPGGLFIVVRAMLIYLSAAVLTNFGGGLKERVFAVSLAQRRQERAMEPKDYGGV